MKKKVLHLITGLEVGGAETMLLRFLPLLQEYFENEVCCIKGRGEIGERLKDAGIVVHYLDFKVTNIFVVVFRLGKLIKKYKPDLMITYLIHADLLGRIVGKSMGVKKIICNERGFYLDWNFLRVVDRWTKFLVTKYFVQTEFAKKSLATTLRFSKEKFVVIPNAIDLKEFQFSLDIKKKISEVGIYDGNINIVCVSTLKPRKGHEELFEAFEEVYQNFKNVNLLIIGDGSMKREYLKKIENYSSRKNILFLGRRDDVREILRISDIFILATYSEGMSNAVLEAMASKLAIITTNIDVNRELIDNDVSGLLVPVKDSHQIAKEVALLINDKEKRLRLGEMAYQKIIDRFEIHNIIELIKNNYDETIYGR